MILSARNMSARSNRSGIRTGCKKTSTLRWFCCLLLSSHICVIRRGGLSRFLNFFHSGLFRVLAIEFKNQVKYHESEDKPPYGVDKIERCRQFTDKKGNNCNQKSIRKRSEERRVGKESRQGREGRTGIKPVRDT